MGIEHEWKFLVKNDSWRRDASSTLVRQGYITTGAKSVRVRIYGDDAFLTLKGPPKGNSRLEFEYPIPVADAETLLNQLCEKPLIEKIRHLVTHKGSEWEIDEFLGDNAGLIIAELELESEVLEFEPPEWLGDNVSGDMRYYNSNLVKHPFKTWKDT